METLMSDATRRSFLKTSAVAAGAGLLTVPSISAGAYAAADDTIKVGLIGCGGRGTGAASQALSTAGKTKLVAVADAFEDNLQNKLTILQRRFSANPDKVDVPKERQFVGFDAYKKLIGLKDLDLVVIATPPGFRPIHFEHAVNAGKHVFAEKPVATDAPGVRRFLKAVEVAKKKNLKVGIGLQRHHQKKYTETVKRIKDGEIGDVVALRVYWNGGGVWTRPRKDGQTEMEYQMRNWYYFNWLCGDHIVEQHIHNLDVGNWIKSEIAGKLVHPVKANGMGGRQVRTGKEHGEIFDHHAVQYEYEDGTYMFSQCRHIRGCWNSVTEPRPRVEGVLQRQRRPDRSRRQEMAVPGQSEKPVPERTRRPVRRHPRRREVQRRRIRRDQHHDRHHGPYGDLLGRHDQMGRRSEERPQHHAEELRLRRRPAGQTERRRLLPGPGSGRDGRA